MPTDDRSDLYVISDLRQIKALADPLRQKILGAFVAEPRTTKQVAALLDQPPTKLYHHVDQLERVGLIELVATRPKRGTMEKYYRAVANRFCLASSTLAGEAAAVVEDTLSGAFDSAQREMRKALGAAAEGGTETRAIMAMGSIRVAPEDLVTLRQRFLDLAKEFGGGTTASKREYYRFLVAIYPSDENPSADL